MKWEEDNLLLYFAYGTGISSSLDLPELFAKKGKADIEVKLGKIDEISYPLKGSSKFWATDLEAFFSFPGIGSFLVHHGREIVIEPDPAADERLIRLYLLGRAFGALLHQRGLLVLHGSAVAIDGGTVAFLGSSGSGKSTVAASLNAKGYPIVSDDLVVIDASGTVPIVYPAFPQLKLWPDVAEHLGYNVDAMPYISPRETKRAAIESSNFSIDPIPLRRIYLLDEGDSIRIRRLEQQEAMIELVRYSYAFRSLNFGANLSSHFLQCSRVAKEIPISRVARPLDLTFLHKFAQAVEDDTVKARSTVSSIE